MTTAQLAQLMDVRQPTIVRFERSEEKGSIELATLRRAAEALDCTLVYALVPKRPLEATVRARARAFLLRRRRPVEHTMLLENQRASDSISDAQIEDVLRNINPSLLWE